MQPDRLAAVMWIHNPQSPTSVCKNWLYSLFSCLFIGLLTAVRTRVHVGHASFLVLTTVKVRKPKGATWFLHSAEPVRPVSSNYWSYLSLLGVTPRISQDERSSVIAHESTPSVSMIIALEHRSRVKRTSFKLGRKSEERSSLLHRVRTCGYCAAGLSQQITSFI